MKKISTPIQIKEKTENIVKISPKASTMAFLKQFARVYSPAPAVGMPGIILN